MHDVHIYIYIYIHVHSHKSALLTGFDQQAQPMQDLGRGPQVSLHIYIYCLYMLFLYNVQIFKCTYIYIYIYMLYIEWPRALSFHLADRSSTIYTSSKTRFCGRTASVHMYIYTLCLCAICIYMYTNIKCMYPRAFVTSI